MLLLLRLSLRNLFRQKRRNLLLGSAMAIGVMLLVLANSYSRGLSDIMLNKVLRWVAGHVTVAFNERGRIMSPVFRDRSQFDFIEKEFKELVLQQAEADGTMVRAIGNGMAENMILVGVDMTQRYDKKGMKELEQSFHLVEGQWADLQNAAIENPTIVSIDRAKHLNVKRGDLLRVRMRNIYGQDQSAHLTVVGLMKTGNLFMGPVMFCELRNVKTLLGYDEHSTGNINLVIKDPEKNARRIADAIHSRLHPGLAAIYGTAGAHGQEHAADVFGFGSDPDLSSQLAALAPATAGSVEKARVDKDSLVAQPLARALGLRLGDTFTVRYTDKWGAPKAELTSHVAGIFTPGSHWSADTILVEDERFYEAFYGHLPGAGPKGAWTVGKDHPAYALLSPEWIVLPRTATTDELEKKYKDMGKKKWHATLVDVRTMYETAEQALKLEGVLNLITLVAVLVLFFIILIGVINTLRMTIRERTREIGTVRAIGMQRADVRNMFILETLLLAFFSSVAGVLLAVLAMAGLSHFPMHMEDNPLGMLLVNGHLYFIPSISGVFGNMLLILILAGVTSYFPARRAARLSPAAALRHFE